MTMFFAKKLNKKGFTLAELLIVVAIIAVLIAIAVPIFTGSLERARLGVHQANARTLKVLGTSIILDDLAGTAVTANKYWKISATYDFANEVFGEITVADGGTLDPGTTDLPHFEVGSAKTDDTIKVIQTSGTQSYVVYVAAQEITKKS